MFTKEQATKVRKMCREQCANYDSVGGGICLPLDCDCPQSIALHLVCKYFKSSVLPADKKFERELNTDKFKSKTRNICSYCGKEFIKQTNREAYCSEECRGTARRKQYRKSKKK